jgi:hypothetical protein
MLNDIFQLDQPQPEMVLDFDGRDQIAELAYRNLPAYLTKLSIINSDGAVTAIEDNFLTYSLFLEEGLDALIRVKTLTLDLHQLKQAGDQFLFECHSLKTLTLSLPQVAQVGDGFLAGCLQLKFVDLRSLLNLENGEIDLFMERMIKLERILIDARQEEFFKELLKNKPDLMSKLKVAA